MLRNGIQTMMERFGANIDKAMQAKRKRLETFTQSSLEGISHKNAQRKKLTQECGQQVSSVLQQWETQTQKAGDQEEKMNLHPHAGEQQQPEAMSSLSSRHKDQPRATMRSPPSASSPASPSSAVTGSLRHERASRLDSSGSPGSPSNLSNPGNHDGSKDRPPGMTAESYALRRENRLAARIKAEEENASNAASDYKKMYEEALATNERLKVRLEGSKQELTMVQTQLERAQRKGRIADGSNMSDRSKVLETEKRERRVLEKKVSDMEDELKVQTELKNENQRLKDENGALIRVISKLSK